MQKEKPVPISADLTEFEGDPWLYYAGMWADDPDWDQFQAEIVAFRQAIDDSGIIAS